MTTRFGRATLTRVEAAAPKLMLRCLFRRAVMPRYRRTSRGRRGAGYCCTGKPFIQYPSHPE